MGVFKTARAKWVEYFYYRMQNQPNNGINGFKKAGIIDCLSQERQNEDSLL